jgi:endonuclease/exonuclease/phosphatase family metal-dependent hydrolase
MLNHPMVGVWPVRTGPLFGAEKKRARLHIDGPLQEIAQAPQSPQVPSYLDRLRQVLHEERGAVVITPQTLKTLDTLLNEPTLIESHRVSLARVFKSMVNRLLSAYMAQGKAEDHLSPLTLRERLDLQPPALEILRKRVADLVTRYEHSNKTRQQPLPERTLGKLEKLASVFGINQQISNIREYKPYQITRGVQHYLLTERVGPPLKALKISTYNLEHFRVIPYHESFSLGPTTQKTFPYGDQKSPFQPFRREPIDLKLEEIFGIPLTDKEFQVIASLRKMRRIAEVIKQDGLSDVVALQEVRNIHQITAMLKIYGLADTYPNILFYPAAAGNDGLAILTTNRVLPTDPRRVLTHGAPRPSGEITLSLGDDQEVTLFNVHFKADKYKHNRRVIYHEPLRLKETKSIAKRISALKKERPNAQFVVLGDFNTDPNANLRAFHKTLGLEEVSLEEQKPTHQHGYLDRVFVSPGLSANDIGVVGDFGSVPPPPSDHLRLKLTLQLPTTPNKGFPGA